MKFYKTETNSFISEYDYNHLSDSLKAKCVLYNVEIDTMKTANKINKKHYPIVATISLTKGEHDALLEILSLDMGHIGFDGLQAFLLRNVATKLRKATRKMYDTSGEPSN